MDLSSTFFLAVAEGDVAQVAGLLKAEPWLAEERNEAGHGGFLVALYHGHEEVAGVIRDAKQGTDVFEAAASGDTERLQSILEEDPRLSNVYASDGFTPLGLAAYFGKPEAVSMLLAAGADANAAARNPLGVRPIHSAMAHRDAERSLRIVADLLRAGADVDAVQQGGWTPLHQACAHGRREAATLLRKYGANPFMQSDDGRTPLDLALENEHEGFEGLLAGEKSTSPQFERLDAYQSYPEAEMHTRAVAFFREVRRRRTVRHFSERPVPREVIENCLRAAGTAPSGANRQPWHFVVVSDPGLKSKIREAAEVEERAFYQGRAPQSWLDALAPLGTDEHKPFLERAPYLIAIFAEKYLVTDRGEKEKNYYVQESVGLATGILITALHHAGLATLTHTPSPMGFLNALLGRPDQERAFLLLVVGYPADDAKVPRITKKSLRDYVTFVE